MSINNFKMMIKEIILQDWINAGLTIRQYKEDSSNGLLEIKEIHQSASSIISVDSIKRLDRREKIEDYLEKKMEKERIEKESELLNNIKNWYINYRFNGQPLSTDLIEKCNNRAFLFELIIVEKEKYKNNKLRLGMRVNWSEFYKKACEFYAQKRVDYPCREIKNERKMRELVERYEGICDKFDRRDKSSPVRERDYASIVPKNLGNDNSRKVSAKMEALLLSLYRVYDKPFIETVHALYMEFVSGDKIFYDKESGEVYNPADFQYKGKPMEIDCRTVGIYLKDVVNSTAIYADRNGNFDYVNKMRPKHKRKLGQYSLSKVTMDDSDLSRKSVRGFVHRYCAVDVVSGYWFRPAYSVEKKDLNLVYTAFKNMFCELSSLNLPIPGEIEIEHFLMQHIEWLEDVFPIVRFCTSATEKRAEHKIKELKYGEAKKAGHTRGRWYAKHEAYRSVRNKVNGDFIEDEFQPQTIIADDLADIEKHNNSLHPLQKTYPGMTRKDVFLSNINPNLEIMQEWYLFKFIGNETKTSIYNNNKLPLEGCEFWLKDYECLERLESGNYNVTAYWLPSGENEGENNHSIIEKAYLYQGDRYIGEAINSESYQYNENAIERTQDDEMGMFEQQKRVAKFDKMIKSKRKRLLKVGVECANDYSHIQPIPAGANDYSPIQPILTEQDEFDLEDEYMNDYTAIALANI
jgi:hypothetical protein